MTSLIAELVGQATPQPASEPWPLALDLTALLTQVWVCLMEVLQSGSLHFQKLVLELLTSNSIPQI